MNTSFIIQEIINGVSLGALYALIAVGYTMVYGVIRLINFAHGDIMMVGCFIAYFLLLNLKLPWIIALVLAAILTGFVGILIDKVAYKPLRDRGAARIINLITAVGVSFFLQSLFVVVLGGIPRAFPVPDIFNKEIVFGDIHLSSATIATIIIGLISVGILFYIVYKTKIGMAMRAISVDFETTKLMGVDVDKIVSFTFFIGSALAAISGFMWAVQFPSIDPYMGIIPGIKAFVAAVFGGIGSVIGAVVGGFIIGVLEIIIAGFFPSIAEYRDAIIFLILILTLLIKPTGLFGEKLEEKV